MNIKTTLKTTVAAAALFAVAVPVAEAGSVSSGGDDMSVTLSGHFNKVLAYADNGDGSRATIADNDISQSRFRIIASGKMNEQVSVSGTMEMSYSQNNLSGVGVTDSSASGEAGNDTSGGGDSFGVRHGYVKFTHASAGSLSIGHTSVASDGANSTGYNPAGDAVDIGGAAFGGVDLQANNAADGVLAGVTVSSFFHNLDGGRTDVIKYQTPSMGGFGLGVSANSDQEVDTALEFGGKFGGISVTAAGAYRALAGGPRGNVEDIWSVAGGVKHDSGLSLSAGYAAEDALGTIDGTNVWVLAGYEANLTSMGATGFAVQYMKSEDVTVDNDEGTMWVVGVQQDMGNGVSMYASGNFYEAERTGTNYEDVTGFFVGTKVKF